MFLQLHFEAVQVVHGYMGTHKHAEFLCSQVHAIRIVQNGIDKTFDIGRPFTLDH